MTLETFAKIKKAKREWESAVDALPDLIALVDASGRVVRINRTLETWNLGNVAQANGRGLHELAHGGCTDPACALDSLLKQAWEQTSQGRPAEGQLYDPILKRHLHVIARPVITRAQPDARDTVVVLQDVSQRVEAEQALRESQQLLTALNKASQAIASTLNLEALLTLVIDEVKRLLDCEGASVLLRDPTGDELVFVAVAGASREELMGMRMPLTKGIAGWVMQNRQSIVVNGVQSDPRFYSGIDNLTGLSTRSAIAVPLRYKAAVWGVIEAINKAKGTFNEADAELLEALARSAAIAIENAQSYQAEKELRRLVEQSRVQLAHNEKLAATGRLAATLAHEINNPLQTIHNCMQLMLNFQLEPDEQRDFLTTVSEEIQRLTGIVTRTLDFARRSQPEVRPTLLNAVVEKALALTGKYLQHRHIALRRELAPDLPPILADPDELAQVLLNLVLNAADAMPEGGTLCVTSGIAENGRVVASFVDTGCGIPPENLGRIFEPFFSTKEGGTGLGLDVSRQITERHGGKITVESQVGKGSTFTVWLPVASGQA